MIDNGSKVALAQRASSNPATRHPKRILFSHCGRSGMTRTDNAANIASTSAQPMIRQQRAMDFPSYRRDRRATFGAAVFAGAEVVAADAAGSELFATQLPAPNQPPCGEDGK